MYYNIQILFVKRSNSVEAKSNNIKILFVKRFNSKQHLKFVYQKSNHDDHHNCNGVAQSAPGQRSNKCASRYSKKIELSFTHQRR